MYRITPAIQHYAWGSTTAIPDVLRRGAGRAAGRGGVVRRARQRPVDRADRRRAARASTTLIAADPTATSAPTSRRGSVRTCPTCSRSSPRTRRCPCRSTRALERARAGLRRRGRGRASRVSAPERSYRDRNHKPELVYALTPVRRAWSGFRAPRRAAELLADLDTPLAADLHAILAADPTSAGVRAAFEWLAAPGHPAGRRGRRQGRRGVRRAGSPTGRRRRAPTARSMRLAAAYPGDPGAVTSVLLNPVTLQPGEALFVPAGAVHAYLHGRRRRDHGELRQRAARRPDRKHVDVPELLRDVDCVAAPPIRIAPSACSTRRRSSTRRSTTSSCR